jgi:iron complex transport system ATP-binding protein
LVRLEVRNLSFGYGRRRILKKISLTVPKGSIVSLVGPNGSGKTTLLRCLVGFLNYQEGAILIDGQEIRSNEWRNLVRRIGYVPQIEGNGFPSTVFDMVLLGRRQHINWRPSERDLDAAAETLVLLNLKDLALRDMSELSGGEKQKVLMARALAKEPELLIMDEPTSSLDLKHQLEALNTVACLAEEQGITVIMAMHDLNLAALYSDRLIMLQRGRIRGDAPPKEILTTQNISSLYGIEVNVSREFGPPHIVLKR